jgi:hypothetical protein
MASAGRLGINHHNDRSPCHAATLVAAGGETDGKEREGRRRPPRCIGIPARTGAARRGGESTAASQTTEVRERLHWLTPNLQGNCGPWQIAQTNELPGKSFDRIVQFKTAVPCGLTWTAFAIARFLLALNCGVAAVRDHQVPSPRPRARPGRRQTAIAMFLTMPSSRARRWEAGGTI